MHYLLAKDKNRMTAIYFKHVEKSWNVFLMIPNYVRTLLEINITASKATKCKQVYS